MSPGFFESVPISDRWEIEQSTEQAPKEVLSASVRNAAAGGDATSLAAMVGPRDDLERLNESAHAYLARQASKRQALLDRYKLLPLPDGRRAESVVLVVGALLELGHRANKPFTDADGLTVAASQRDLARLANLGRSTVQRALLWLREHGWLTADDPEDRRGRRGRSTHFAMTYTLASPGRLARRYELHSFDATPSSSSSCEREGNGHEPVQVADGHVLWSPKGYGGTGRKVYEALRNHPEGLTVTAAASVAGVHRNTATSRVAQLVGLGLARRDGRLVVSARTDLDEVAAEQGLMEWRTRRAAGTEREQSNWRAEVDRRRRERQAARCPYFASRPIGEVGVTVGTATLREAA